MDIVNTLKLMAWNMTRGSSLREVCPECCGGSTKEKSLVLTLDEQGYLLWKCHRASCECRGKTLLWGVLRDKGVQTRKPSKDFTGALEKFPEEVEGWLLKEFGITRDCFRNLKWRFAIQENRMFIPIMGPPKVYKYRGCILREWKTKLNPKTLTFKTIMEEPFLNWMPQFSNKHPVVIVEDAISAAKVYQTGLNALSLSGTHLNTAMIREIISVNPKAILALDKDATAKAVKYAGTFRDMISLKVWKLEKDLKYVSEDRIWKAYFNDKVNFQETAP